MFCAFPPRPISPAPRPAPTARRAYDSEVLQQCLYTVTSCVYHAFNCQALLLQLSQLSRPAPSPTHTLNPKRQAKKPGMTLKCPCSRDCDNRVQLIGHILTLYLRRKRSQRCWSSTQWTAMTRLTKAKRQWARRRRRPVEMQGRRTTPRLSSETLLGECARVCIVCVCVVRRVL